MVFLFAKERGKTKLINYLLSVRHFLKLFEENLQINKSYRHKKNLKFLQAGAAST